MVSTARLLSSSATATRPSTSILRTPRFHSSRCRDRALPACCAWASTSTGSCSRRNRPTALRSCLQETHKCSGHWATVFRAIVLGPTRSIVRRRTRAFVAILAAALAHRGGAVACVETAEPVRLRATLPEGALAKRALDRRADALQRELALVAQKADNAVKVGLRLADVEHVGYVGIEKNPPHIFDRGRFGKRVADHAGHVLDRPVPLH